MDRRAMQNAGVGARRAAGFRSAGHGNLGARDA